MSNRLKILTVLVSALAIAAPAFAADDLETLRQQLADQRSLIEAQQRQLEEQARTVELLSQRLEELYAAEKAGGPSSIAAAEAVAPVDAAAPGPTPATYRDNVGDLNSGPIEAGEFAGSFKIPGTKDVSLAIGGLIKTVAISDSDAEAMGADFLPATLGTRRSDTDGAFNIDSTLSRITIDGRAPARNGHLRGYFEWDLNGSNNGNLDFKVRHAYGTWRTGAGTLLAGHTWSTLMDLQIIPEGLTEPTVSGVIFNRQPQIRWSQPLADAFTIHAAVEDPSSNDVFDDSGNPELANTKYPDVVLGLQYDRKFKGHLRLNGIVRDIRVNLPAGGDDSQVAWGLALSGHLDVLDADRWVFSGVYGEGLGRYLLGIQPTAGAVIDPIANELGLRDNWGAMTAYRHQWSESLRSTAMVGHAKAKSYDWQPDATFEDSTYASVNLMWQILPYLTVGVEYAYGESENKSGERLDNSRVALGFQVY